MEIQAQAKGKTPAHGSVKRLRRRRGTIKGCEREQSVQLKENIESVEAQGRNGET